VTPRGLNAGTTLLTHPFAGSCDGCMRKDSITTAAQAIATGRAKATCPTIGNRTCWLWLNVFAAERDAERVAQCAISGERLTLRTIAAQHRVSHERRCRSRGGQ